MLCSKCRQNYKLADRQPEVSSAEEINCIKRRNNILKKNPHSVLLRPNVCEISHTNIKLIIISVICRAEWFMLKGEECFSVLIRQQLISSQTACVPKQTTEPRALVSVRRVRHSLAIAKSQHLKSCRLKSQERPLRNVNTHKNSAGSYLLLERLLELTEPGQTKTKTFPMHVSNQPSRLN